MVRFDRLTALTTNQALAETHLVVAEDVTEERHGRPGVLQAFPLDGDFSSLWVRLAKRS